MRDAFPTFCPVTPQIGFLKIRKILSNQVRKHLAELFLSEDLPTVEKRDFIDTYFDLLLESKSYGILDKVIVRVL